MKTIPLETAQKVMRNIEILIFSKQITAITIFTSKRSFSPKHIIESENERI